MLKKFNVIALALLLTLTFLTTAAFAAKPAKAPAKYAAQEKQIKALVAKAAGLIKAKGEAAMAEINANKDGRWGKAPTGIFVSGADGLELANAVEPASVGKNLWGYKDPDGKLVVQEQWKLVKAKGKGWYEGKWAKPGTDKPVPCRSYVKGVKAKGKQYLVGAAYYPE
ncbi:MAG: cache domain-containing protein [Desulfarculus sp.]|nr:cache domain-containing protein [Desulfarculus sp.]